MELHRKTLSASWPLPRRLIGQPHAVLAAWAQALAVRLLAPDQIESPGRTNIISGITHAGETFNR
jgi:hypothetical protein